jgi:alpha-amylase
MKNVTFILFAALMLTGVLFFSACPTGGSKTTYPGIKYDETIDVVDPGTTLPADWWKSAVFYEVYVRGFKDSDGDGIGDLAGLTSKLDYLKDLGIGGIWLMPITESSDNDHGYATIDYRDIEDDYGDMDDFNTLLTEAHARGIGVIMDLVINHSSNSHPFFTDAAGSTGADYRSWYVWAGSQLNWQTPWGANTWHVSSGTGTWYHGIFWSGMPDLNYKNPSVQNYMADTVKFWLNNGVDGFRFDAVPYLVSNGADKVWHQPETATYYQYLGSIFGQYTNIFTVGEDTEDPGTYISMNPPGFDSAFAFGFNEHFMGAIQLANAEYYYTNSLGWYTDHNLHDGIAAYLDNTGSSGRLSFMQANHDNFAGTRPFTQFNGESDQAVAEAKCKLAATFQLAMPGTPFIYYGEEIAIAKNDGLSGDHSIRTPMQWNSATSKAGFTTGTPFRNITDGNYLTHNVEDASSDPGSVFNHYRKMISIRNSTPALQSTEYQPVMTDDATDFFACIRSDLAEDVVVVLNFSTSQQDITLDFTGTTLEGVGRTCGTDLYDGVTDHTDLNGTNNSSYVVSAVGARSCKLIPVAP